ncbi:MAG: FKBP-type peptidyl-prolyl cis-trans isomerase [Acidobacteriota bacterium]
MLARALPLFALGLVLAMPATAQQDDLLTPPPGAEHHDSGLISMVLVPGSGLQPDANDLVAVHFTGYTKAGAVFQQTEPDEPAQFALDKVFPGWREGIALMRVGETRRLWIPAHLGPPNTAAGPREAIFDVELTGMRRMPDPPAQLNEPPEEATRRISGVFTRQLESGKGDGETPEADGRVLIEYTAWNEQGVVFDSTIPRGRPTAFQLDRVLPAFAQVVQEMTVGERQMLWIPRQVHAGQWPNAPKGMMVIDVKVVGLLGDSMMSIGPEAAPGAQPMQGQPNQSPTGGGR